MVQFRDLGRTFGFKVILIGFLTMNTIGGIGAFTAHGQNRGSGSEWFSMKGSSTLTGHYGSRVAEGQQVPSQFLTWYVRSKVAFWGIPFDVSGLISTLQDDSYQVMNHFSFQFNPRAVSFLDVNKRKEIRWFKNIETFEVGRARPDYSELMIHGVVLDGLNTEIRYKKLYTVFCVGNTKRLSGSSILFSPQLTQRMVMGQMGIGRRGDSFIHLSLLKSSDRYKDQLPEDQLFIRPADTLVYASDTFYISSDTIQSFVKPSECLMVGIGSGLLMFKKKWRVSGELIGSAYTANLESDPIGANVLPSWISCCFTPRLSSSASYAWLLSSSYRSKGLTLKVSYKRAAPGFRSPGVPYSRQDYSALEVSCNQLLMKNRLLIHPWIKSFKDHLSKTASLTTRTLLWGINAIWRPKKGPYISFNYTPTSQYFSNDQTDGYNKTSSLMVSAGKHYSFRKGSKAFTSLTWSGVQMESNAGDLQREVSSQFVSFQQSVQLTIPLSIQVNLGYSTTQMDEYQTQRYQMIARVGYKFSPVFMTSAGIKTLWNMGVQQRTGFTGSVIWDTGKAGVLKLSVEPFIFRDQNFPLENYNDYSIRFSFVTTF